MEVCGVEIVIVDKVFKGGVMNGFGHGRVYGVEDLEDAGCQMVYKPQTKIMRKSPKIPKGCNYPGKIITINRDCSKCAREIKLQVGSDLVFLDGKPYLLPVEICIQNGVIVAPIILWKILMSPI